MNSIAQLAILTKLNQLLAAPGTFLSFPIFNPTSYAPGQLRFDLPDFDLTTLAEFSRITNQIPDGIIAQPTEEAYFWNLYEDLLRSAVLAADAADPAQEAAYQHAAAFLYVTDTTGLRTDSPALLAYKQYQDLSLDVEQAYAAAKSKVDASTDPAVTAHWVAFDEPKLRRQVDQADDDWASKGFKDNVENNLATLRTYAANQPATRWREWSDSFNPDIDLMTDLQGQQFAPTAFSPANVADAEDWPSISLGGAEILHLLAAAPPALKQKLEPSDGSNNYESIHFEFRCVNLVRPWFRTEVLHSRFWRLPAAESPLSNGRRPPQGRCTAYITGLVLARGLFANMSGFAEPATVTVNLGSGATAPPHRLPHHPGVLVDPPISNTFSLPTGHPDALVPSPVEHPEAVAAANQRALLRLKGSIFKLPITPPPPTSGEGLVAGAGNSPPGDVSIAAFLCTILPRCPDPDPGLHWSA